MNFLQLRYFSEVYQTLNVTKAAENLYISRPTISRAIRELEEEYGVILFNRTKYGLTVTKEGHLFYDNTFHIQELVAELEAYMKKQRSICSSAAYKLNIGLSPLSSTIMFPKLYRDLKNHYPNIILESRDCYRSETSALLVNGTLDFFLSAGGKVEFSGEDFSSYDICETQLVLYTSLSHPLAGRDSITIDEIGNEPLVQLSGSFSMEKSIQSLFTNVELVPNVRFYSGQVITINELVERGLACSIAAKGLLSGKVSAIPIVPETFYHIGVVWFNKGQHSDGFDLFLRYLSEFRTRYPEM